MTDTPKPKLTRTQREALERARDCGDAMDGIGMRQRTGGAYSRMLDRLAERGLLTRPPHEITETGRAALG